MTTDAAKAPAADSSTWPLHFELRKPETVFGDDIAALDLREPTAADFLTAGAFNGAMNGDSMLDLIAKLSGQTPATIRALPGIDMMRLSKRIAGIIESALK